MADITMIIETIIKLACLAVLLFVVPCLKTTGTNNKLLATLKISDEIAKIAAIVVRSANELEITGELLKLGMTKADYALEQVKKELESKGITFDEDLIVKYIKAAVTELRVEIANTPAEKEK